MTVVDPSMEMRQRGAGEGRELAMLAHDVRGALQGVLGGIAQLEAAPLALELREQLDRASAAARSLACLLGGLLGDAPEPAAHDGRTGVEVPWLLAHLRQRFAGEAREKGMRFAVEAGPGLPERLEVELSAVCRILCNLIGDAIRHGGACTVRLACTREPDGGVAFRVADDGPSLGSGGTMPDLGAPEPGHGLGLHVVRELAARIGGGIAIGDRPGTEAVLRLPAGLCTGTAAVAGAPAAPALPDLSGLAVLLAEDNPTNQMVASQMLRALNAEVTVCSDGVEALERFEADRFDLVVVDIEMPRLSGLDVIRAIRARPDARARVPIVALTAYAMREHRDRIAEAGADGLVSKPVTSVEALGRSLMAFVPRAAAAEPAAAAPASVGAAGGVVDLGVFDALAQAIGAEMMAELLDKVVADLATAREDLVAARAGGDLPAIRSSSHILISVAGALGAMRLQACARRLNAAAHGEAPESILGELALCLDEIDAAVAFARARRAEG